MAWLSAAERSLSRESVIPASRQHASTDFRAGHFGNKSLVSSQTTRSRGGIRVALPTAPYTHGQILPPSTRWIGVGALIRQLVGCQRLICDPSFSGLLSSPRAPRIVLVPSRLGRMSASPSSTLRAPFSGAVRVMAMTCALAATLWLPAVAAARSPELVCATAESLLEAGLLAQARPLFEKLAKMGQECLDSGSAGVAGLVRLEIRAAEAKLLFVRAQAVETGATEADRHAAVADVAAATVKDRGVAGAEGEIKRLLEGSDPPADAYAVPKELAQLGFETEAKTSALAVAKEQAARVDGQAFPAELRYLVDDPPSVGRDVERWLRADPGRTFWADAAGILWSLAPLLAAAALFGWLLAKPQFRLLWNGRAELKDLADSADGKVGGPTTQVMRDELSLLAREGTQTRLGFVAAPDAGIDIPAELGETLPQLGFLSALRGLASRPRNALTGRVLWDEVRGSGLSLALSDPLERVIDSIVMWERDFRLPGEAGLSAAPVGFGGAHARLATAAAAWLAWTVTKGAKRTFLDDAATASWRSYALFRLGAQAHLSQDGERAAAYYRWALALDLANTGANFNLASLILSAGPADDDANRVKYLTEAADCLNRIAMAVGRLGPELDPSDNPLSFRAAYNEAVIEYEKPLRVAEQAGREPAPDEFDGAIRASRLVATKAADRVLATREWRRWWRVPRPVRRGWDSRTLREVVLLVEQAATLLAAGAIARRSRLGAPANPAVRPVPRSSLAGPTS
jgi:hypothetical protein